MHFIVQVQEGKEYELVLTNVSGLYRYRLGDVVKISGFLNQCPIFEFQYRYNTVTTYSASDLKQRLIHPTLLNMQ